MMESFSNALDQAVDPLGSIFQRTAETYDRYLSDEYAGNFFVRRQQWQEHYRRMRASFSRTMLHLIEEKGIKRSHMNTAIVGPGLNPVDADFDFRIIDDYLAEMKRLVITDFSTRVIRAARLALTQAGIPFEKQYGFQFDITNGLSTVSEHLIGEMFANVTTEDEFYVAAEKLSKVEINELSARMNRAMDEITAPMQPQHDHLFSGGLNKDRTWALTANKQPIPLDLISFQMVTAGTGAAAEGIIWERLHEVTSDTNRGAREVSDATNAERRKAVENVFSYISRYNTAIMKRILRQVLIDNPDATCLVITDTSTILRVPRFGQLPRVDLAQLRCDLERPSSDVNPPINMTIPTGDWNWDDEPEHSHGVTAIEFRRAPKAKEDNEAREPN